LRSAVGGVKGVLNGTVTKIPGLNKHVEKLTINAITINIVFVIDFFFYLFSLTFMIFVSIYMFFLLQIQRIKKISNLCFFIKILK